MSFQDLEKSLGFPVDPAFSGRLGPSHFFIGEKLQIVNAFNVVVVCSVMAFGVLHQACCAIR